MITRIFDNIEQLNVYLDRKNPNKIKVGLQSFIVGERKTAEGKVWEIVDRFFVIEQ